MPKNLQKAYTQIYTGNGKGKTTAALGLAVRAIGAGLKVFIGQFVKGMHYSELDSLKAFEPNLTVKQYGRDCFIYKEPTQEDIRIARQGFLEMKEVINCGEYDVVIMDEIAIANYYNMISVDEVLELLNDKPESVELILTGRYIDKKLIEAADLVTEMREIKHYYTKGVQAREGIEK